MIVISLFSGIEGIGLAAEAVGWTVAATCEIESYPDQILQKRYPGSHTYHHKDIKTLTGEIIEHEISKRYGPQWRANGVMVAGGFPCQPYSIAGQRKGDEDDRALWGEMHRLVVEIGPDWVFGENVPGLVTMSDGLVLLNTVADLEASGYTVFSPNIVPACAVNAPHRRDRLFITAFRHGAEYNELLDRIYGDWDWRGAVSHFANGFPPAHTFSQPLGPRGGPHQQRPAEA